MNAIDLASRLAETPAPEGVATALRRRLGSLDGSLDGEDRLARALNLPWTAASIARPQFGELHSRLMDELFVTDEVADLLCDHLVVREHQLTSAPDASGPRALLCLVGPPGVGKSHIAHEIAEHLGLRRRTEYPHLSWG